MPSDVKYVPTKRWGVIKLEKSSVDGFWRDPSGTVYAYATKEGSVDDVVRCGVGWFSLSAEDSATAACGVHDYLYQCPVYQAFHNRSEAEDHLRSLLSQTDHREFLAEPFGFLAHEFGGQFWEEDKTRDK